MWFNTCTLVFALIINSISSYPSLEPFNLYEDNGIYMPHTTVSALCKSHLASSQSPTTQLRINDEIIQTAWAACSRRQMQQRLSPKRICPSASKYLGAKFSKFQRLRNASESILDRLKSFIVKKYIGNEFQALNGGELILGYLPQKDSNEQIENLVVAEWIACYQICVPLGAVWSPKVFPHGRNKIYTKCDYESSSLPPPGHIPGSQDPGTSGTKPDSYDKSQKEASQHQHQYHYTQQGSGSQSSQFQQGHDYNHPNQEYVPRSSSFQQGHNLNQPQYQYYQQGPYPQSSQFQQDHYQQQPQHHYFQHGSGLHFSHHENYQQSKSPYPPNYKGQKL